MQTAISSNTKLTNFLQNLVKLCAMHPQNVLKLKSDSICFSAYAQQTYTFFRFGKSGKPLSVVRPTLMRLSDSRALKSSVRPEICVERQLSRFKSAIYNNKHAYELKYTYNNLFK